jgi:branched-chain amino acid transport system substrate-binding protein
MFPFDRGSSLPVRKALSSCAAVLLLFGLVASASQAQQAPFQIDVMVAQSGSGASVGDSTSQGLRALEQNVNRNGGVRRRPIQFVFHDDQSNPQLDVELTNQVLAGKPSIVLDAGPAFNCGAVAALYAHGPVLWCLSPAFYPDKSPYAFTGGFESVDGMKTVLTYMQRRGWKRIGILTLTDLAGQEADRALHDLLATPAYHDLTPVAWEHFGATDISIQAQLARMRTAAPQAVIAWASGAPNGTFYVSLRDAAWDVPVLGSSSVESGAFVARYNAVFPKDYYIYSAAWPAYAQLPKGPYKTALGKVLSVYGAAGINADSNNVIAWDSAMIVVQAFQKLGFDATPDQLRDYVANVHDYVGISGAYDFRAYPQRGLGINDSIVVKWNHAANRWDPASGRAGTDLSTMK